MSKKLTPAAQAASISANASASLSPRPKSSGAEPTFRALDAFRRAAEELETEPASLALAWLLAQPDITAVVVGLRNTKHLGTALAALELELSDGQSDELASLFR